MFSPSTKRPKLPTLLKRLLVCFFPRTPDPLPFVVPVTPYMPVLDSFPQSVHKLLPIVYVILSVTMVVPPGTFDKTPDT